MWSACRTTSGARWGERVDGIALTLPALSNLQTRSRFRNQIAPIALLPFNPSRLLIRCANGVALCVRYVWNAPSPVASMRLLTFDQTVSFAHRMSNPLNINIAMTYVEKTRRLLTSKGWRGCCSICVIVPVAFLLLTPPPMWAGPPPTAVPTAELARLLRDLALANLPDPLIEKSFNWGSKKEVPVGVKWKRQGPVLRPEIQRKWHHDGMWRKIKVIADAPARTLRL